MRNTYGIVDYANEHNIHLVSYVAASHLIHSGAIISHLDVCFDVICKNKTLDGMILFSGFFADSDEMRKEYYDYVSQIPPAVKCISVSHIMGDMPAVVTDNVSGVYNAVSHLIREHGKRQIAFVKGPDGNQEAEERLTGYKNALRDNGIPFDRRYVLPGDFTPDGGTRAAHILLDERKIPFDAVAISNDAMAIRFINALRSRNILVPESVAVTGFDNDSDAAAFVPSIIRCRYRL